MAPSAVRARCAERRDAGYSSDVDDCRFQYGDDAADADELTNLIYAGAKYIGET
jgi:hypothetical protein